jgi:3-deoxy-D-manno-octulosonate 8-phosphate phosphatase (KDO 8-P phosphatase)
MGVSNARKAGLIVTLISGEDSPLVDRFAEKFQLTDITKGCRDKAGALRSFAERQHLPLSSICFMGDDTNDIAAQQIAGLSAAPADAHAAVLAKATFITKNKGGNGAVRELIDAILAAHAS